MSEEHPLIGKVLEEDYKIVSFLGKGGMGSVFMAEQPSLNRKVAIKILPSFDLTPEELQRFELEIASMATLNHPNIVTIHHRGKCGDPATLYYVMEFLEGGSLKNYLQQFGVLMPVASLRLIRPVAEALSFAHEQGCIHRDIKPDNLLFTPSYRSLKIADFGIAKLREDRGITKSKALLGTFLYAAPEQMQWYEGEEDYEIDGRVDQYSLGVVLYEMVAGKLPYEARSLMEIIKAFSHAPIPLAKAAPQVPKTMTWLVETMIAKDPHQRFPDDDSLLDALTNVELEVASSVSTRIFAIKSQKITQAYPPSSGIFPTPLERSAIQNLETQCTYRTTGTKYQNLLGKLDRIRPFGTKVKEIWDSAWGNRHNMILTTMAIVFCCVVVIAYLASREKNSPPEERTSPENIQRIVEETHSNVVSKSTDHMVSLKIAPAYFPQIPIDNPNLEILFISPDNKWVRRVQLQDTIPSGSYKLSVMLAGYSCPDHGKVIDVPPVQLFHLTITLNAKQIKVNPKIINTNTGEEIVPLEFKIDNTPVWDNRFPPGKHQFYVLLEFYQEIHTAVEIPPGEETFQYRAPLVKLQQNFFTLNLAVRKPSGNFYELEAYKGRIKVHPVHLKYKREEDRIQGNLWIPPDTETVSFYLGYYFSSIPAGDIATLTSLEELDGNRLMVHLKQIKNRKLLLAELERLLEQDSAKISALRADLHAKFSEFLKERTGKADYEEMDSPLWQMRYLVSSEEREERDVFQQCLERTVTYSEFTERETLWKSFLQKYPQGVYYKKVTSLIAYNSKLSEYEHLFRQCVQECVLSPSEKRSLKKLESDLRREDVDLVKQKIAVYLKECKCDQTLEEMLRD